MAMPLICTSFLTNFVRQHLRPNSGPNWIHGTDHNPILDLAKETNSVACSIGEVSATFDENGDVLQQAKSDELSGLMWGVISDAFKYSNETPTISPNRSLKDFFAEEVSKKDMSDEDKKVLLQMAEIWGGFIGDHVENQSLKFFWLEECIDGGKSSYFGILRKWI